MNKILLIYQFECGSPEPRNWSDMQIRQRCRWFSNKDKCTEHVIKMDMLAKNYVILECKDLAGDLDFRT